MPCSVKTRKQKWKQRDQSESYGPQSEMMEASAGRWQGGWREGYKYETHRGSTLATGDVR